MSDLTGRVIEHVVAKNPNEAAFHQAVREVLETLEPVLAAHPEFVDARILERLVEPERVIIFRVPWVDDDGVIQVSRGFRVQMNSAIGPYKGGLRFHRDVTLGLLKFLAFEQTFKNALTTLPMGGGKGGADFDPKGKSDDEVRRFCQSFMSELYRHIGQFTDVPAGDIGVGSREIGYLFGQYKRITNTFTGTITGKGVAWGGSFGRPEATGFGAVYFAEEMLKTRGDSIENKTCLVSGSGNVAQYTVAKLIELGARVLTMSDSDGFVLDTDGFDEEKLAFVLDLKNVRRGRIAEYVERFPSASYFRDGQSDHPTMWSTPAKCAFPCATQNEISGDDAAQMLKNGVELVVEGANMPTEPDGVRQFLESGILFGPGKAANAGGVAVSGLEMTQNIEHSSWTAEEVDMRLREIMSAIHEQVRSTAAQYGEAGNYVAGANIAGFLKVAQAMLEQADI
ncbi:MAG: NADP-specific glutamate dehydrogenase [Acidimicrobiales bacterium]